jgi:ankyrin repeat protein
MSIIILIISFAAIQAQKNAGIDNFIGHARSNNIKALEEELRRNPQYLNTRSTQGDGQTALMAATLAGAADSVRFLLTMKADHTIGEKDDYTVWHGAGFQGRANVAKVLLEFDIDPNASKHKDGFSPLHRACWGQERRHSEFGDMILKKMINLKYAKCFLLVKVLLESGKVDVEARGPHGQTPLQMTQNVDTMKVFEKYLEKLQKGNKKTPKSKKDEGL